MCSRTVFAVRGVECAARLTWLSSWVDCGLVLYTTVFVRSRRVLCERPAGDNVADMNPSEIYWTRCPDDGGSDDDNEDGTVGDGDTLRTTGTNKIYRPAIRRIALCSARPCKTSETEIGYRPWAYVRATLKDVRAHANSSNARIRGRTADQSRGGTYHGQNDNQNKMAGRTDRVRDDDSADAQCVQPRRPNSPAPGAARILYRVYTKHKRIQLRKLNKKKEIVLWNVSKKDNWVYQNNRVETTINYT